MEIKKLITAVVLASILALVIAQPVSAITTAETTAIAAGKLLSNNQCVGTSKPKLSVSPMRFSDFSLIVPYGLMVGSHVTPIDHQYFYPADRSLGRDAYVVRAMADSRVVDIGSRPSSTPNKDGSPGVEYRIVFTISCKLLYYYDLVTSLSPTLKAAYDQRVKNPQGSHINIPVKAGQTIGRIGGQTLDFAVWDTDVVLSHFIVPSHYSYEAWKIHTANPLSYETDTLKALILPKFLRTVGPISGRIDYDIDGRLRGTWFKLGTSSISGSTNFRGYYKNQLAFAPDHLDPTGFMVSVGNWKPDAQQFAVLGNTPNPASVSVATGLVKYSLVDFTYKTPDGSIWDRFSLVKPLRFKTLPDSTHGCFLVQLIASRRLKAEAFPTQPCSAVSGFTTNAILYER